MAKKKPARTTPDCQTCGLCCCAPYGQDAFCDLTPDDIKRLGRNVRLKVWYPGTFDLLASTLDGNHLPHAALKTKVEMGLTVCTMLKGVVGRQVSCSVYADRPEVCRTAMVPGDRNCRALRKENKEFLEVRING